MPIAERKNSQPGLDRPAVTAVAPSDQNKALAVITLAFASDPMMRWSFPDTARYLAIVPAFVRAFGGNAFAQESADQTGDFAAVALWLPPNVAPDGEAMGAIIEAHMPAERMQDGAGLIEQMGKFHPTEPHWYLPLIGTDPLHQGKGFGSALLEHAMRRCDKNRMPAYLESSSPGNVPLYERFGFKVMGTIQQGSSPPLFPMFRPAR